MSQIEAKDHMLECQRVLDKVESNVVWEILRQSDTFYEWNHYPDGDVYDQDTHAQYYYHAHPQESGDRWHEHGHFHLFLRDKGIPEDCKPLANQAESDNVCHLIAVSMDEYGKPKKLFTTNRWVTGETWYSAEDVCQMLDHFYIDHAWPSWPTNLWLNALVRHHKEEIIQLICERDRTVQEWQQKKPSVDVFEDRELEVTSMLELS